MGLYFFLLTLNYFSDVKTLLMRQSWLDGHINSNESFQIVLINCSIERPDNFFELITVNWVFLIF